MVWNRLRTLFSSANQEGSEAPDVAPPESQTAPDVPEIHWIEPADNPWGVRVLDVRPVTLTMLSMSSDPRAAGNAVSFGQDDGRSFIGTPPRVSRVTAASLTFPIDRMLADGVLFVPSEMEHKWALFFHNGEIICVRSWRREVVLVARVDADRQMARVTEIRGTFAGEDEDPDLTVRLFDCLIRSHTLNMAYPVPLPPAMDADPKAAALWCMSIFGNRAVCATPHRFDRRDPELPLRTH